MSFLVLAAPAALIVWLPAKSQAGWEAPPPVTPPAFEEETGIRITRIALVGGDGIVDVRFDVLDPDKAIEVHDDDSPLVLIDETDGSIISVSFHGKHSGGTTKTGLNAAATYYLLFANSGGALEHGEKVSVALGDVRLEHVPVQ